MDDHQVGGITVPHPRRRMEGINLKADGRRSPGRIDGVKARAFKS
ncbi:hypothetical protein [Streptomyces sp. NBC_00057]